MEAISGCSCFPVDTRALTFLAAVTSWLYLDGFLAYVWLRRMVKRWDAREYLTLTGMHPTMHWDGEGVQSANKED